MAGVKMQRGAREGREVRGVAQFALMKVGMLDIGLLLLLLLSLFSRVQLSATP